MEARKALGSEKELLPSVKHYIPIPSLANALSCKICHDEDEGSNMEVPCSCSGTLKYAHRECVQRWCNEKGDTTCEICKQQFEPGYKVPPPSCHYGGLPFNNRGSWEFSRSDLHDHQFIDMVDSGRDILDSDYGDYAAISSGSLLCCRVVTIIFLVLLFLRITLPIVFGGTGDQTITFFLSIILSSLGIFLPIYVMVKAFNAIKYRRNQQEAGFLGLVDSDEENELRRQVQPQMHLIHFL